MKYSKQSELVRNAMVDNKEHPTADMIYALLKPNNPGLSLATVYRNLNKLAEKGDIVKITIPNSSDRFDATTKNHYHMICSDCGNITDCPVNIFEHENEISNFNKSVFHDSGFSIYLIHAIMYGTCKSCSFKKKLDSHK